MRSILWEIEASRWGQKGMRFAKLGAKIGTAVLLLLLLAMLALRLACSDNERSSDPERPRVQTIHNAAFDHATFGEHEDRSGVRYERAEYLDELAGLRTADLGPGQACKTAWLDVDTVDPRDNGEQGAVSVVGWMNETIKGRTTTGRYIMDVWNDYEPGTGAFGFVQAYPLASNVRLIERLPPPKPGPPGWIAITPGQCVLGSLKADARQIVGRYWVELPAGKSIALWAETGIDGPCLQEVFEFEGMQLACEGKRDNCNIWGGCRYRVDKSGGYGITIYRGSAQSADVNEHGTAGHYCLMVAWGETVFDQCDPTPGRTSCF